MVRSLSHYRQSLLKWASAKSSLARWYSQAAKHRLFLFKNWGIGKFVELSGNRVIIDGVTLSLENSRLHGANGRTVTVSTTALRNILNKYEIKTINLISDSECGEVEMVSW